MQNSNLARSLQFLRLDTYLTSVKCDCNNRNKKINVLFCGTLIFFCCYFFEKDFFNRNH